MSTPESASIPLVLLSERTYERAQREGITNIVPAPDQMLAIGDITETGQRYLPDVTVLRDWALPGNWDIRLPQAAAATPYIPATELSVDRDPQTLSAEELREQLQSTGRRVIELAVKDWEKLGKALAASIEELKIEEKDHLGKTPDLVINALSLFAVRGLGLTMLESPSQRRIRRASSVHPYEVIRAK